MNIKRSKEKKYRPKPLSERAINLVSSSLNYYYAKHVIDTNAMDANAMSQLDQDTLLDLMSTFQVMKSKIDNNALSVAYTAPATSSNSLSSLSDSLGIDSSSDSDDREAAGEAAYNKYLEYLEGVSARSVFLKLLSNRELELAKEHMYSNDLMTPEQEALYEQGQMSLLSIPAEIEAGETKDDS